MTYKNGSNGSYQMITPPNLLKAKVGSGGGIDPELVKKAESVIDGMQDTFRDRVISEVARIGALVTRFVENDEPGHDFAAPIFKIAHDLKGQGATFDYPLVTEIGTTLCAYLESLDAPENMKVEVVRAHTDALRAVVTNSVEGEGGEVGTELVSGLRELVECMQA